MVLLLDNRDSFVHTLARYVRELGNEAVVRRSDVMTIDDIGALAPSRIIISPGPCTPDEAGISTEAVRVYGPRLPILGVCLGHQCIGAAYGARIIRAGRAVHGRTSHIVHTGAGILRGVPSPFLATRYHSLVIARDRLPPALDVIAEAEDDHEIMAIVHRTHPVTGVQFHPESAATEFGYTMLDAFLRGAASRSWPAHADGVGARILATSTERPDNHRGDYGQEEE